jgi:hypothetical protein
MKIEEIISLAEDQVEDIKTLPIIIKRSRHLNSIRENMILDEGRSQPTIVVDVQPEYCGDNNVCQQIINFVQKQTGPVLMFVNAEEMGLTGDTVQSIRAWWEEQAGADYDEESDSYTQPINWSRFKIVDKGYGYLRSWMDHGIEASTIIATIRELYQQKKSDSRELSFPPASQRTVQQSLIMGAIEEMDGDPLIVNWISLAQLKKFSGAYLVGGCRNECLREVEFLMNAFNIRYKRVDSLVYENFNKKYKNQQGVAENFADGKKPGRKGLAKRMRVPTKASVSRLRQIAKTSSGERARMAHWMANMKAGKKKKSR